MARDFQRYVSRTGLGRYESGFGDDLPRNLIDCADLYCRPAYINAEYQPEPGLTDLNGFSGFRLPSQRLPVSTIDDRAWL